MYMVNIGNNGKAYHVQYTTYTRQWENEIDSPVILLRVFHWVLKQQEAQIEMKNLNEKK